MTKHLIELINNLNDIPRPVGTKPVFVLVGGQKLEIGSVQVAEEEIFIMALPAPVPADAWTRLR